MLKIKKEGNSLIVEGIDNGTYIQNGENSYPLNSIFVVIDESEMATFKSVANADVLFSGLINNITINGENVTRDTIIDKFDSVSNSSTSGGGSTYDDTELRNRVEEVEEKLDGVDSVQEKLVSGTNLKTINNESLLGSGNIEIKGGGDSPFVAEGTGVKRVGNYNSIGNNAFAENVDVTASGTNSHAEGYYTQALGNYSHAEGYYTTAEAHYSHAEGDGSKAEGQYSHAEGNNTVASGRISHAEGEETNATNYAEHSSGKNNKSTFVSATYFRGTEDATLFSIGNGLDTSNEHNAFEVKQNGDIYIPDTSAAGEYYEKPMIKLQDALKSGGSGSESPFEAAENGGVRRVGNTRDLGTGAFAENVDVTASGQRSHAEGQSTKATNNNSHAEGNNTTASGNSSHAEGNNTTASGGYSHAEGEFTKATAYYSHAEGHYTTASGNNSHAEGLYTTATNFVEHASGQYNNSTTTSSSVWTGRDTATLFSVGNGNSTSTRHNAFEIKQNGDIYIPDTTAEGEYYEKPMIKLQDALKGGSGDIDAYTKEEADNKFAEKEHFLYNEEGSISPVGTTRLILEPASAGTSSYIDFKSLQRNVTYVFKGCTGNVDAEDGNTEPGALTWYPSENRLHIYIAADGRQTYFKTAEVYIDETLYGAQGKNSFSVDIKVGQTLRIESSSEEYPFGVYSIYDGTVSFALEGASDGSSNDCIKIEANNKISTLQEYLGLDELGNLRADVENALGDIAALGYDKQNKLSGNYLATFETNGGHIDFAQRSYDGLTSSTKTIDFKTINSQAIIGQGDIKIDIPKTWQGTQSQYNALGTYDANTTYYITD